MGKRTLAEAPDVELVERDLLLDVDVDGETSDTVIELMIGDWLFDSRYRTRAEMERMIETIDQLHTSLDVARARLFEMWQEGKS